MLTKEGLYALHLFTWYNGTHDKVLKTWNLLLEKECICLNIIFKSSRTVGGLDKSII